MPPVATYVYNGTATVAGVAAYRWNDPRDPNFEYFDTQSTRLPLAFYDHRAEIGDLFTNLQVVQQWPTNFWTQPQNCR